MTLRKRFEQQMESFARGVCRHRWLAATASIAIALALAAQTPKLTMDTSSEGFLAPDDPIIAAYNDFRNQFGRNEIIVIAIEPPEVFQDDFLRQLASFHGELERGVPHLQDVTSLINARNTRGEGDVLVVEELVKKHPEGPAAMAALKKRVMSNPQYRNAIISEDGRFTTVIIKTSAYTSLSASQEEILSGFDDDASSPATEPPAYLTNQEASEALDAVQSIVAKYRSDDFKISMAGSPVIMDALKCSMKQDMTLFMRLAILAVGVCLFLLFRRLSGVLLPLLVVAMAVVSAMGLMAVASVPIKMSSMILPSFLLAVGVGDSMHLLVIFYQNLEKQPEDRQAAIIHSMGHSGLPIVMTSLTTAAGLASFAFAEVDPVADLGTFASIGVLIAMVYSLVLLPALLAIVPIRTRSSPRHRRTFDALLGRVGDASVGSPHFVLAICGILLLVSLLGISRLQFSHNLLTWLPDDLEARRDTEKIDSVLHGSVVVEVVIDTGQVNGLYDPVLLEKLDRVAKGIRQIEREDLSVGRTSSFADVLKEIHQALHANEPEHYAIPTDRRLISQEVLLFENAGSDDLQDVVDSRFSKARLSVVVPWVDALRYLPFLDQVKSRLRTVFAGDAEITITGLMTLFARTISAAIHSAARSYVVAFVVITFMMILLVGGLRDGLVSMIPNLMPIITTLGLMGWLDLPLDMFTMLIGSIAIGLVVDDTVHFMHSFRRYFSEIGDVRQAVRHTLDTSGRAMLATTVALSIGFLVFSFGSMNNVALFGILTATTIVLALLSDFIMAPALMALIHAKRTRCETEVCCE